ncbi:unnamed protein product [Urochloa humidicola]
MTTMSMWLLRICVLVSLAAAGAGGDAETQSQVYVVYMGAVPPRTSTNLLQESHLRLVSTVLKRSVGRSHSNKGRRADSVVVRQYKHGFSGFAARLSKAEAAALRRKPGVVSVFPDPVYQLHTTRSWDFLQQTAVKVDAAAAIRRGRGAHHRAPAVADGADSPPPPSPATDTIIGLLDSGIWPESPSFNDAGFGPVPSRWNGTCMAGENFNSSNCNKKLIGARYYNESDVRGPSESGGGSPRDDVGHGTHTSSTAAGNAVTGASYYGLAAGTAKGGSAASRVAMYRVCSEEGCSGSAILASTTPWPTASTCSPSPSARRPTSARTSPRTPSPSAPSMQLRRGSPSSAPPATLGRRRLPSSTPRRGSSPSPPPPSTATSSPMSCSAETTARSRVEP